MEVSYCSISSVLEAHQLGGNSISGLVSEHLEDIFLVSTKDLKKILVFKKATTKTVTDIYGKQTVSSKIEMICCVIYLEHGHKGNWKRVEITGGSSTVEIESETFGYQIIHIKFHER